MMSESINARKGIKTYQPVIANFVNNLELSESINARKGIKTPPSRQPVRPFGSESINARKGIKTYFAVTFTF